MAYRIISPRASFVQFSESNEVSCLWGEIKPPLPVALNNDIAFMFVVEADTEGEANALAGGGVTVGIVSDCDDLGYLVQFASGLDRAKASPTQVLYMQNSLPGAMAALEVGECFRIRVRVELDGTQACSTTIFERVLEDCFTSVVAYYNDDAGFGFPCAVGSPIEDDGGNGGGPGTPQDCTPTVIDIPNVPTMSIPYTAEMQAKYGDIPTSEVYIYDENGVLTKMGITAQLLGGIPPDTLYFDFGGPAMGKIRIS